MNKPFPFLLSASAGYQNTFYRNYTIATQLLCSSEPSTLQRFVFATPTGNHGGQWINAQSIQLHCQ